MSLIAGLHLLERFYLISDTRVTSESNKSDLVIIKDNLIKAFNFNDRISAVAAGQALPASYLLNKLKERINASSAISDLKKIVNSNLKSIISDYVNITGHHSGKVAFIIAGFDFDKNKKVEASLLGNAMSAMVKASGEGKAVQQTIDTRLIKALHNIGGKGKGDYVEVKGIFQSQMFTITLDVRTAEWELKDIQCYEYAIFHPDQSIKTVSVPEELLSILEFRERLNKSVEDRLYEEAESLINFARRATTKYEFWTVGGHIFILLQTPDGNLFPTGDFGKIKEGRVVKEGSFFVEDGKMMYQLGADEAREYRHLEDISKNYLQDKSQAYLQELIL